MAAVVDTGQVYTATFTQHATSPLFTVSSPSTSLVVTGDIIYVHKLVGSTDGPTDAQPTSVLAAGGQFQTIDEYGQEMKEGQWKYEVGTEYHVLEAAEGGKTFTLEEELNSLDDVSKRTIEFHRKVPPELLDQIPDPGAAEPALPYDGWGRWTGAGSGTIVDIAEKAASLAEELKTSVSLAQTAMTAVKWIAELSAANAYAAILNKLADDMLAQVQDIKNAGYWYLLVDPYLTKNVEPQKIEELGWQVLRDDSGRRLWWKPAGELLEDGTVILPEDTTVSEGSDGLPAAPQTLDVWEPKLAWPRKVIAGGFNSRSGPPYDDKFKNMSPFPKYNAKKVVKTMIAAMNDEGDVPKYKPAGQGKQMPAIGAVVFNEAGEPVLGWDPRDNPTNRYGEPLYNMGSKRSDGSAHLTKELQEGWKDERVLITLQEKVGRPLIQGSTMTFGAFSKGFRENYAKEDLSTPSSAVVFLVGAISFEHFAESFNNFSKLFTDLAAIGSAVADNLVDTYEKFSNPDPYILKLTLCDSNYKLFEEGDVIRGTNFGGLAKIVSVNAEATMATSMVSTILTAQTDDIGQTRQRYKEVDLNAVGRYMDMEVGVLPIATMEAQGPEKFIINDTVYEQEKVGKYGQSSAAPDEKIDIWQTKGADAVTNASQDTTVSKSGAGTVKAGSTRVYPKYGVIAMEKLEVPRESVKPDFQGIQIGQLVPMWNEVFEYIEGYINQVKGYVATSTDFIDDMIGTIEEWIAFLDDLVETITEFLKFFEVDLSNSGIYSLHISGNVAGTAGIANELESASGLPDNLDYAMGIIFIGSGDSGPLLDVLFDPNDRASKGKDQLLRYG